MRKLLILLFLIIWHGVASAEIYYVDLAGSNSNDGSYSHPFETITYAFSQCTNGGTDTVYVFAGHYYYTDLGVTILQNINGASSSARHLVSPYPGHSVVIDFIDYTSSTATQIMRIENCDYVTVRGFELKHNLQLSSNDRLGYGFRVAMQVNNCWFERLNVHHCGGWGVIVWGGSDTNGQQSNNNTFYRIDSHHHSDRYSGDPWGGSDGFLMNSYNGYAYPSMGNQFIECRAWMNSDDGWDNRLFNGSVTYIRCWAFWNGFQPGETDQDSDSWNTTGNGYGFKCGSVRGNHSTTALRTMHHCLAFENAETGIQAEWSDSSEGGYCFSSNLYNNTAYDNGMAGFSCGAVTGVTTTLRNNISFLNAYDVVSTDTDVNSDYDASDQSGWNGRDFIPSAADFASLSSTGVDGPRGSNGELPFLDFLRLASNSDLIDAGTNVSLSYEGSAPDIGAFEYGEEDPGDPGDPGDPPSEVSKGKKIKISGKFLRHSRIVTW